MHQTRAELTKKIPMPRKGTKYVARALSDLKNSVPVVIAVRDMLKSARTAKEVKEMIKQKLLKINGKEVKDLRESIKLFSIFEAGELYILTLTDNGKFVLAKTSHKERPCKVIKKTMVKQGRTQINLHDGSNILTNEKINIQDTVYIDISGKIVKSISFEKGKEAIIISGKFAGQKAVIESAKDSKAVVKLKESGIATELEKKGVMIL